MAIEIGPTAGHHFNGQADLTIAYHAKDGTREGFYFTRKWLFDRVMFGICPSWGWARECWFEWKDDVAE